MVDNDCDQLIDCIDPDCSPTRCAGGTEDGEPCSTDDDIMACNEGGGVCQCPAIRRDPTTIKFGRPGDLDQFKSHGRLIVPDGVDLAGSEVGWLLSNNQGRIYGVVLPPGSFTPTVNGTSFRYRDRDARIRGGIRKARIRISRGTTYSYWVEAYGDMSAAVDPNMSIQVYLGNPTATAIHSEEWSRMRYGWKATGFAGNAGP